MLAVTFAAIPRSGGAQETAAPPVPATILTSTMYGGIVTGLGDHIGPSLQLFVVGAQFGLQRQRVEWIVFEPFALWTTEGPGFMGGLQTAWTVSLQEGGPYVGIGAGVWSPTRGWQAFATGRVGIHPVPGKSGLRFELQVHDRITGDFPNRMAILLLGFQIGQRL
jgi:hypothetical protein